MPDRKPPDERTAAQRLADHDGLSRLSVSLVPALVAKLNASALAELEVREGDWRVRLRRPPVPAHRRERTRPGAAERRAATPAVAGSPAPSAPAPSAAAPSAGEDAGRTVATSPTVGVFRAVAPAGARVRAGDRIADVDLLGIAQAVAAPIDGVLVELLAETGEAVEYGEALAVFEAADDGAGEPVAGEG